MLGERWNRRVFLIFDFVLIIDVSWREWEMCIVDDRAGNGVKYLLEEKLFICLIFDDVSSSDI